MIKITSLLLTFLLPLTLVAQDNNSTKKTVHRSKKATTASTATGTKVLYMGDSITDGGWGNSGGSAKSAEERNHWDMNHIYGHSYMFLCATHYQSKYPEREYKFYNRGVSGYTLADLEKRWDKDVIGLKPDVLSILIGTNDVGYHLRDGIAEFDFSEWESRYRHLLQQTVDNNPDTRIVLCAPFVAPTGNMRDDPKYNERKALTERCAQIVQQLAKEFRCVYVPFDQLFRQLQKETPAHQETYWIWDGIHPTPAGHRRMADLWIKATSKVFK